MKTFFLLISIFTILNANYKELLFNGNCVTCHKTNNLNKSAPTIMEIQKRYKNVFLNKDEFVLYMTDWVYKPNEKTSIMQDAIDKYELMPELAYDKNTLKEISEFIYDNNFESEK